MAGTQKVTYDELRTLENEIDSVSVSMTNQLQKLANVITQLEADWRGIAANTFRSQQMQLNDDHDALRRILDGIKQAVHDTNLSSQANESDVLQSLRSIDINGSASGSGIAGL
ncbi:hypothetical protein AQ490_02260 [Wenjunlia vitaminophila]|uniref:WXG100 family type VII secretion target n=1 Tax=Wenjunlia vitaminophila TaxID=76728 RepID=A0A0T6LY53_WENVI|nr:WXG100 family type VII secretion target [Wenjunlia vitaminophila]KRV51051.1 hypothetical protein AQ490_02260 [Wenjunlia vitaminophila]